MTDAGPADAAPSDPPPDAPAAADDAPAADGTGAVHPTFSVLDVTTVQFHLPSPSPVVQLRERDAPFRELHFPLGLPEAQAIALALEHERSPRPSTAELLDDVLRASGAELVAVRITGVLEGTMLGELDLMTARGRRLVDCRPSDGIALALRQGVPAPILCEVSLLEA